jgi:hypothetical protein
MYAIYASQHELSFGRPGGHGGKLAIGLPSRDPAPSSTSMPPSRTKTPSNTKSLPDESKLQHAVDVLLRDHQDRLPAAPKRPERVTRRDSYSTISTARHDTNDQRNFTLKADYRNGGFIPLEISFPSPKGPHFADMPKMQKSKGLIPDWRDISDFYGDDTCEDIVFVPVEAELASRSSSMEVIRKLSKDSDSSASSRAQEAAEPAAKGNKLGRNSSSTEAPRYQVRRTPSKGVEDAAPPPARPAIHQLSFRIGRVEI